jgi:hypothetical protein
MSDDDRCGFGRALRRPDLTLIALVARIAAW